MADSYRVLSLSDETLTLSLTGENSHVFHKPSGQGSLSIGTKGISEGKYDIWVEEGYPINWEALNGFYIPASRNNPRRPPYGDWPRWFYYSGDDAGFISWSSKRYIEDFTWIPHRGAAVDLTGAHIGRFFLRVPEEPVKLKIGKNVGRLSVSGHLENLKLQDCDGLTGAAFERFVPQEGADAYRLPVFEALKGALYISIGNEPMGQPFDCGSLLQFSELTCLSLWGNVTNLEALARLKHLESLELRYVPDLSGMPGLGCWERLNCFIGYNIEETAGKTFRAELKQLAEEREFRVASVTRLRKAIWFTTEYGIPFSGWEDKKGKAAVRAYKTCLKEVKKAETEEGVHQAVTLFVQTFNRLPDMETVEREDVGMAVEQLVEVAGLGISRETGQAWFDGVREF